MNNVVIRLEMEADYRMVEERVREAFWNVYKPGCDEHYYTHMLRQHKDFLPALDFVLELEGEIIGSILYTKTRLLAEDGTEKEILTFGPLWILPRFQRQGYGKLLIEHSFAAAMELGYDTVVIFGNPGNYVARGFVSCRKKNVCLGEGIYPMAMLVKELVPGVLEGKSWQFLDSDAGACCEDLDAVEAFERTFPPMEKAWMPSQEEFYIYSHSCVVRE